MTMAADKEQMMKKMCHADGFIAALDQSGGSSEYQLLRSTSSSSSSHNIHSYHL